jgi:hypothetical protein
MELVNFLGTRQLKLYLQKVDVVLLSNIIFILDRKGNKILVQSLLVLD